VPRGQVRVGRCTRLLEPLVEVGPFIPEQSLISTTHIDGLPIYYYPAPKTKRRGLNFPIVFLQVRVGRFTGLLEPLVGVGVLMTEQLSISTTHIDGLPIHYYPAPRNETSRSELPDCVLAGASGAFHGALGAVGRGGRPEVWQARI